MALKALPTHATAARDDAERLSLNPEYCVKKPEKKVALGFVEGWNNKIPCIQRRSYGLHVGEYLKFELLTCTFSAL